MIARRFAEAHQSIFLVLVTLLLGFMALCSEAIATVVQPLEVEALATESDRIVRAQIISQHVVPERGPKGQIYTRTEISVLDDIRGHGPQTFFVQQLGGQLGDLRMTVSGNARLAVGTEVLLFLERDPATELHYVVGLAQGHYTIDRSGDEALARRDLDGLTFYRVGPQPVPELARVMTLETLLNRVRHQFDVTPSQPPEQGGVR